MGNHSRVGGNQSICDSTHELQPVTFTQLHVRIDETPEGQRIIVHENSETIIISPYLAVEEFVVWEWVIAEGLKSLGMMLDNMSGRSGDEFRSE